MEINTTHVREVKINYKSRKRVGETLRSPADVSEVLRKVLPDNSREHFIALYLDGSHSVVGYSIVATGAATSCQVHPREIFQPAVLLGAVSLIIAHNHPSGSLVPSTEDRSVTDNIGKAARLMGVRLLDHIIVTDKSYHSFQEEGHLF